MMASFPRCRARLATRCAAARLRHRHATSLTHTINRAAIIVDDIRSSFAVSSLNVFGKRDARITVLKINTLHACTLSSETKIGKSDTVRGRNCAIVQILSGTLGAADDFSSSRLGSGLDLNLSVGQDLCIDSFTAREASPGDGLLPAHRLGRLGMVREHHHALAALARHGHSLPRNYVVSHID